MKLLADELIGNIQNPLPSPYQTLVGEPGGLVLFFTNILRLVFIGAGIYAFINLIVAGFSFMTAAGDSKKITEAWNRIWQSLLGLVLIVGSFALASVFGQLVFGNPGFILSPKIFGPGQ